MHPPPHLATPGSRTACVVGVDRVMGVRTTANLGDSGFVILRKNKVLQKSEPQQEGFNCPLQLGTNSHHPYANKPEQADRLALEVKDGDCIIIASDGLFDNVFITDLPDLVAPHTADSASAIASFLQEHAVQLSRDRRRCSPFETASRGYFMGGKEDDITVVVAKIHSATLTHTQAKL